ncbi:COMPASS component SPP1 [Nakaseomyces bracarensis]|uniref:COMPASS component SPP1 n=1 Tax=Nakaseomyces bracarensis TaxID=273131 RepID=A0ABR4NU05_9SACH
MSYLPEWCPPYSSRKHDAITGEEVYCICKKPDNGELMVGCDGCDDWFHFRCMKLSENYRHLVESFICPYCAAGITGPGPKENGEYPRSMWKRKCRVPECYDPCAANSKYCTEEHGKMYMQGLLERIQIKSNSTFKYSGENDKQLIGQILDSTDRDLTRLKIFGSKSYIDQDIQRVDENSHLYDTIIANDKCYNDLMNTHKEIENEKIPEMREKLRQLDSYLEWIDKVNELINSLDNVNPAVEEVANNKGKRKKKKSTKKKVRKSICGYCKNIMTVPCEPATFVEQYTKNMTELSENNKIQDVCVKMRCNKHSDWAIMSSEKYSRQIMSQEAYLKRLELSIATRKRQLNINYFEQLLKTKA